MNPIHATNKRAWDERVRRRLRHTQTATDKVFRDPAGMADIHGWVGRDLKGKRVLCLGAGGGRHGPLYAAAGASVTVVDISPKMLELDRAIAHRRGLLLHTVEASMDDMPALSSNSFDFVIQPVSTCYVPDVVQVYREVARVTVAGGLYISQHKQPVNMQAAHGCTRDGRYLLIEPYDRQEPLPDAPEESLHREPGCLEFLHGWQALLGGLCRSGFVLEDLLEPLHADPAAPPGSFGHRSRFIPPYVTFKARRNGEAAQEKAVPKIWVP